MITPSLQNLLKTCTVLYAEDDILIRENIGDVLDRFFNRVICVSNGVEAVQAYANEPVHVVMLDIEMPRLSGLDVAKQIREHDPHIPIIILSGLNDQATLTAFTSLYLVDYILKPLTIPTLKSTLEICANHLIEHNRIFITLKDGATFNLLTSALTQHETPIELTDKEQRFLQLAAKHPNTLLSYDLIAKEVWKEELMSDAGLKNFMLRLRKKIGRESITTIHEMGYLVEFV